MLEVKEQDSLANSLKKLTDKEEIEGYTCEKCKKKVSKISKRTYFHELPEIMILNLQRIIFDPKKGDKIKVHSSLTFPTEIDFT
jgi:ubiquitin C-terminal hydrolase